MITDTEIVERVQEKKLDNAEAPARPVGIAGDSLKALVEEIVFRLPGCTELEIRKTLQRVAKHFCERTNCWQESVRMDNEPNAMGAYECHVPSGAIVVRVRENRHWITPEYGSLQISGKRGGERAESAGWQGIPGSHPIFFPPPSRHFIPFLHSRGTMPVFALAPELGSECLPPEIISRYGHAIVSGTMAELCAMTGRPWSDASVAQMEAKAYENALGDATVRSIGFLQAPGEPLSCRGMTPFI